MPGIKEILQLPPAHDGALWQYRQVARQYPMHRHDELELNLVQQGTASYLLDDRRYDLSRRHLLWLFPGQNHVLLNQSPDYVMWIVVWRPRLVRQIAPPALRRFNPKEPSCRQLGEGPARRLAALFQEIAAGTADRLRLNTGLAYALRAAWAADTDSAAATLGTEVHPAVERAARLLGDDPRLTLTALAARAGLSASRLSHLFRDQTGNALVDFRNRRRLDQFLALYGDGLRHTLIEAALTAGFGSYAQFHRVFVRLMHCSPAAYRRQL